jgi:hypothetical protein
MISKNTGIETSSSSDKNTGSFRGSINGIAHIFGKKIWRIVELSLDHKHQF